MPTSYERINYNLRPAKSVERKMLCEAFKRLVNFSDLAKYKYIGFGSIFFSDFFLIHKTLGITDLVSIDKVKKDEERFKFNCPYKCIKLYFGDANDILPTINWAKKVILWLDYDYKIKASMLTDIGTFVSGAKAGSIITLTMDVGPDPLQNTDEGKTRCEQLEERVGKGKIPIDVKERELDRKNYPEVCYNIVNNEIDEVLTKRNWGLEKKFQLTYKQLFNFLYKDGSSPMLSIGGIIYAEKDEDKINSCNLEGLEFIKSQRDIFEPYTINVPNLTFREMRSIDKMLPLENNSILKKAKELAFMADDNIKEYSKIYRYFPNFVEAEMH